MANVYAPFGLRYISRRDGAQPNYAVQTRPIFYTDSGKIAQYDVVKTGTSGYNQGYITQGSTNSQNVGLFIGVQYTDSILGLVERPSWTAPSTAIAGSVNAKIVPDQDGLFEIQVGNLATPLTQTSMGLNAALGGLGSPTTTSGISVAYLDGSTIATTSTLPLRIVGFSTGLFNGQLNDPTSANPVVLVQFNNIDNNNLTGV